MKKLYICRVLFIIYMIILIAVLIFKLPTTMVIDSIEELIAGHNLTRSPMQLVPFKTLIEYVSNVHSFTDWFIKNLACNIIMFIPFALLFPEIFKNRNSKLRRPGYTLLAALALTLAIELFQYLTCFGLCDIDDVILNMLGALIGVTLNFKNWLRQ